MLPSTRAFTAAATSSAPAPDMATAASQPAPSVDYWRGFFRAERAADILKAIEGGILLAAADFPADLRAHRDRLTERLYTVTTLSPPQAAPAAPPAVPRPAATNEDSKLASGSSLGSSNHVETVTEEPVPEPPQRRDTAPDVEAEVFQIKEFLTNSEEKSDAVLLSTLQRLYNMELTVDVLKATEIGKAVTGCRKHSTKRIRHLAHILIESWKATVDEWVKATSTSNVGNPEIDQTPQSMTTFEVKMDKQAHSPSLDDGNFFAPRSAAQILKPPHAAVEPKQTSTGHIHPPRRPQAPANSSASCEEGSMREKLEIAKRRLREGYQTADNAKKQRTIQVVDMPPDMPSKGVQNNQQQVNNRKGQHWSSASGSSKR